MKVKVVTDSGALMTRLEANALGIDYLPLQVTIDEQTYLDGMNLSTSYLYDQMEKRGFSPNEFTSNGNGR